MAATTDGVPRRGPFWYHGSLSACAAALVPANAVVSRWFARRLGLALGLTALGQG